MQTAVDWNRLTNTTVHAGCLCKQSSPNSYCCRQTTVRQPHHRWTCARYVDAATYPTDTYTDAAEMQAAAEFRSCVKVEVAVLGSVSVLMSLTVSVDVKQHWTVLQHWSQFVPNMSTNIRGHEAQHHPCRRRRVAQTRNRLLLTVQIYITQYWHLTTDNTLEHGYAGPCLAKPDWVAEATRI